MHRIGAMIPFADASDLAAPRAPAERAWNGQEGRTSILWLLQWELAIVLLVPGLLKAGIKPEILRQVFRLGVGVADGALAWAGWMEVAGALLIVIPAASGFWPRLTPLAAAILALTQVSPLVLQGSPFGQGSPADILVGLACGLVAAAHVLPSSARHEEPDPPAVSTTRRRKHPSQVRRTLSNHPGATIQ